MWPVTVTVIVYRVRWKYLLTISTTKFRPTKSVWKIVEDWRTSKQLNTPASSCIIKRTYNFVCLTVLSGYYVQVATWSDPTDGHRRLHISWLPLKHTISLSLTDKQTRFSMLFHLWLTVRWIFFLYQIWQQWIFSSANDRADVTDKKKIQKNEPDTAFTGRPAVGLLAFALLDRTSVTWR